MVLGVEWTVQRIATRRPFLAVKRAVATVVVTVIAVIAVTAIIAVAAGIVVVIVVVVLGRGRAGAVKAAAVLSAS